MMLLPPTPSQTIGPFFGHALPYPGGGELATGPDVITLHGQVFDGAGEPIPDALIELWQPPRFGRVATDTNGHYEFHTVPAPYFALIVFARGLLHHLHTRAYLTPDPRFATLLAVPEGDRVYRFDIRLQYDGVHEETVFLAFDC